MKISKKTKKIVRNHKDCNFVDKYGRQFKHNGSHLELYRGGNFIALSWFSSEYPEKVWRIAY